MRIFVTADEGQVGGELAQILPTLGEVIQTNRSTLNIADRDALVRAVRDANPEVIVNAAAYTAVDKAESEDVLATRVNGEVPGIMADEAKRLGALLVHYSTDYVFDGTKREPYGEDDATNPQGVYGRSKLAGDLAILDSGCRAAILRTSWVYAPRGRNFYLTIRRKLLAGESLRVVEDQVGVPTSAAFLARATVKAIELATKRELPRKLYNVVPDGDVSWCGFARAIAARIAPAASIEAIPSSAYPQVAKRPMYSVLDNRLAKAELGLPATRWETLLDECVAAS